MWLRINACTFTHLKMAILKQLTYRRDNELTLVYVEIQRIKDIVTLWIRNNKRCSGHSCAETVSYKIVKLKKHRLLFYFP